MKLTSLKPGDLVFNVTKTKMGNTTLKTISIYPVKIIEVHENHVIASWNGNAPKRFGENVVSKWKKKQPLKIVTGCFFFHLLTTFSPKRLGALPFHEAIT